MTSHALRQKYLDFFKSKGHAIIASAPLIPENDPTVLFTTAGMHPLVPYLMGQTHPEGKRLANVQKCIRTQDIDEVGDNRHDTFFEMMGNWSLGDYFKKEAIEWSWEFLTDKMWLGLDPRKLAVSVFLGDENAPKDDESAKIWVNLGVPMHKIAFLSRVNNWWGPAGQTGPCGPDTEMFYWMGKSEFPPEDSNPATDENNWLEIWNDVFMQYNKQLIANSSESIGDKFEFVPLAQKNVDTGMGLERTLVVLNGYSDVFQIDTFWPLIQKIESISGREYIESPEITKSMRIIADHIRTATMIMGDDRGVAPSNVDQGYIVRRLIRRAVRHGRNLGLKENFCSQIAEEVIKIFKDVYPEVNRNREFVLNEIAQEESKFRNTIESGLKELEKLLNGFRIAFEKTGQNVTEISGKKAFLLFESYGFPLEMTQELAVENGLSIDVNGFEEAYKKHQELSRAGAEQKFKGGLADNSEMSTKYHTATHLLHAVLREVLGKHVEQKGSNITAERLRFDFSHPEKLTDEQKKRAEDLLNYAVGHDYNVSFAEMSVDEAKEKGAIGLFGDKYEAKVKVYSIGDPNELASAHENSLTFSREICGGPHVEHTGNLGKFKIIKEEAVSAGVRRIKAILE
ncbi:MAG: alanine--tRNA ligase [Candidatus Magasanikbacteria bacterium RIFOXYD2_FULL_41_14]|uniref:Alanine--tRNA ligase n=1 Tax=Candidatus Magasanikbacteria bacterium RIFOXYD2_FULL_41_14 TaxID=1798709 RepID=A0A1F6PG09_9BACT|nr:MAG: alanine--tRNA ligase [Candidatus Magasanikbacteria bacterium RIFOXYD2_FULL_41_14]